MLLKSSLLNWKTYFLLIFYFSSLSGAIEESIIPFINSLYQTELNAKKYTKNQFDTLTQTLKQKEEKLRVATFNILFHFYDQNLPETYRWSNRKERVVEMILHLKPDVLGIQEAYATQLEYLIPTLSKEEYIFCGFPEEDGEYNGIFYHSKRFDLIGSTYENHLNTTTLKDKISGKIFTFCNTHLSFSNPDKRESQALSIQEYIKQHSSETLFLTGDMNTFGNYPYLTKLPFYDGGHIEAILKGDLLHDAKDHALLGHVGPFSTFTNEGEDPRPFRGTGTPGIFLDHIYVSKNVQVLVHGIESGRVDRLFPSDHLPVIADVVIN